MRITITYIILILNLNTYIYAQDTYSEPFIIKGTVFDITQKPIENVNLKYKNTGTITDENGNYELLVKGRSSINIIVSHISYKTDTISIIKKISEKSITQNIS